MGGADIDGAVGSVERPLFGMVAAAGGMGVIGRTVGTSMGRAYCANVADETNASSAATKNNLAIIDFIPLRFRTPARWAQRTLPRGRCKEMCAIAGFAARTSRRSVRHLWVFRNICTSGWGENGIRDGSDLTYAGSRRGARDQNEPECVLRLETDCKMLIVLLLRWLLGVFEGLLSGLRCLLCRFPGCHGSR